MEPDRDLPLSGEREGGLDEAPYFGVGMVERQRAEDDRQLGLSPANGADLPTNPAVKRTARGPTIHALPK